MVQIETTTPSLILNDININSILIQIRNLKECDHIFMSVVDIIKGVTTIKCIDEDTSKIVSMALTEYNFDSNFSVNKILLRKTDLIPKLKSFFMN